MAKSDSIVALKQISTNVTERDHKILENEAYHFCISKEIKRLNEETARIKKATKSMEGEDAIMAAQLEKLKISLSTQQNTLKITEQSLTIHKKMKQDLLQEAANLRAKYDATLDEYNDELRKLRLQHESTSTAYQSLRAKEVELKKLKIVKMDLEHKIQGCIRARKLCTDIHRQIFLRTVVNFVEMCVAVRKAEDSERVLVEKKREEQELLKEHMKLKELLKTKEREALRSKEKSFKLPDFEMQFNDFKAPLRPAPVKKNTCPPTTSAVSDKKDLAPPEKATIKLNTNDKLMDFISDKAAPLVPIKFSDKRAPLTSVKSTAPPPMPQECAVKKFNDNKSKVKILDMKVLTNAPIKLTCTPPASKAKPGQTPADLRRAMEEILAKGGTANKGGSSRNNTPTCSQTSQHDNNTPYGSQEIKRKSAMRPSRSPRCSQEGRVVKKSVTFEGVQKFIVDDDDSSRKKQSQPEPNGYKTESSFQFFGKSRSQGESVNFSKSFSLKSAERPGIPMFSQDAEEQTAMQTPNESTSSHNETTSGVLTGEETSKSENQSVDPFNMSFNTSYAQPSLSGDIDPFSPPGLSSPPDSKENFIFGGFNAKKSNNVFNMF